MPTARAMSGCRSLPNVTSRMYDRIAARRCSVAVTASTFPAVNSSAK